MTANDSSLVSADIVAADTVYTLDELCSSLGVEEHWVVELVEYGAVAPFGPTKDDWRFTYMSIVRVAKARRLQSDLELNLPGIALALDLLDEIEVLRVQLMTVRDRT